MNLGTRCLDSLTKTIFLKNASTVETDQVTSVAPWVPSGGLRLDKGLGVGFQVTLSVSTHCPCQDGRIIWGAIMGCGLN